MFNRYRIDAITQSQTDHRYADVDCQVWHTDNISNKWIIRLQIKMSGLTGNPRYQAIEDALNEIKNVPDISDMEDPKEGEGSEWTI